MSGLNTQTSHNISSNTHHHNTASHPKKPNQHPQNIRHTLYTEIALERHDTPKRSLICTPHSLATMARKPPPLCTMSIVVQFITSWRLSSTGGTILISDWWPLWRFACVDDGRFLIDRFVLVGRLIGLLFMLGLIVVRCNLSGLCVSNELLVCVELDVMCLIDEQIIRYDLVLIFSSMRIVCIWIKWRSLNLKRNGWNIFKRIPLYFKH